MAKTLLDYVQSILSSLDSDEVNSIGDTVEARQVADIVKTTYFNIISRANLPEHNKLFQLTASGDSTKPVLMYRPDNVRRIDWIKYNEALTSSTIVPEFTYVTILPVQQYLDIIHQYRTSDTNVQTLTIDGQIYYYKDDQHPRYCTILKDYFIIFDAYHSTYESTLEASRTLVAGLITPTFNMTDTFTPDIDSSQEQLLLNEAKAVAFSELKQVTNQRAEQEARRQWVSVQKGKKLKPLSNFNELSDFGRR